ncbi:MAG TPA: S41 family peptidase, partial [Myxococcota bacterium]|nr:S41 family peptidase [Myxococcota bacterium]
MRWWLGGWFAVAIAADVSGDAAAPEVPEAYRRSVDLIERSYMYPSGVTPTALLGAAADGAELGIDWLYTDVDGGHVALRHANGRVLGEVSADGWADLPAALYGMEALIDQAGISYGKVDLRLTLLAGMTTVLDDYSRFLAGDKLDSFDTRLKGTLVGIGVSLRRVGSTISITEVTEDGPAAQAGVLPGDVLVRIAGVRTTNLPIKEASRLIRGAAGTQLALDVARGDEALSFTLTRQPIVIENVAHEVLDGDVGYVRIDNVSQQTVRNMARALGDLRAKGALDRGLVLDLRGNTGGSMKESAGVVDQLVRAGLVITTVGRDGHPVPDLIARLDTRADGAEPDVPLVVLVDPQTASGAEIIAGALQELGRAVLIGRRTFGKGQVQKIYPLDEGLSFKMTVAEYHLAHERPVAGVGVQPDVHVGYVSIADDAVRVAGWDPERERVAWRDILPAVSVTGEDDDGANDDVELELARRAVLRTTSGAREHVLGAVLGAASELRVEQEDRLRRAMEARGLDWTPSPGDGAAPERERRRRRKGRPRRRSRGSAAPSRARRGHARRPRRTACGRPRAAFLPRRIPLRHPTP